ncbi:MAG: hypothetical protein K5888_07685 [Lachnospiraceae bacterium]|nr:hypothetical protein [Lachnospiraceae bacterium]
MKKRIDWHLGTVCAIQNDLRDYSDILTYETEHPIGNNYFRIDLLIIRRISEKPISKVLARDFRKINLFEIKGIGSSLTIRSYYKLIGYAGTYIDSTWGSLSRGTPTILKLKTESSLSENSEFHINQRYTRQDITLNLISRHYPAKLIKHLENGGISIEKVADGIYDISGETFTTKIIVSGELSPEDYLYLRCLTNDLKKADKRIVEQMVDDCKRHRSEPTYVQYMKLFINANTSAKGDENHMVMCEELFELYGTSSEEIRKQESEKLKGYYDPLLNEANERAAKADKYRQKLIDLGVDPDA